MVPVSPLLALGLSLALGPVVLLVLRRLHTVDNPCPRSSHTDPTPRGGGVAPAVAAGGAALASGQLSGDPLVALLAGGVLYGAIGLVEDLRGVPAIPRLLAQLAVALAVVPWLLNDLTGPLAWRIVFGTGVVLWLASYVNAFNFMDGINGISVAQVVVAGVAWWLVGRWQGIDAVAAGGLIVALAALGFLPFNFPRARMFLGDVGSYFLGAVLAVLAVLGLRAGLPFEVMFAPLSLYLADTGATLVRRARRRDTWYEAHCDHAYQRLHHGAKWSHARTTGVVAIFMIASSALGFVSLTPSILARIAADAALVALIVGYLSLPYVLTRARQPAGSVEHEGAVA